jgi:hypothetical protein
MKKLALFIVLITTGYGMYSQNLELNELATPATPAFTLLGLSPTNISRPTHSKPFLMDLANGLDGTSIAANIAIESTPYWWVSHPELTYKEFYGLDTSMSASANVLQQIARTFAISFATSDASPSDPSVDSRLIAAGLRFQLLDGQPSSKYANHYNEMIYSPLLIREVIGDLEFKIKKMMIDSIENLLSAVPLSIQTLIKTNDKLNQLSEKEKTARAKDAESYVNNFLSPLKGGIFNKENVLKLLEDQRQILTDEVNANLIEMQTIGRVGWLLEFAGAASSLAPTNNITYTMGQDWAAWATLTYRLEPPKQSKKVNDFNLMARFGGNFEMGNTFSTDLGTSWVLLGENFSLSLEAIYRGFRRQKDILATDGNVYHITETSNTWRYALSYQYRLTEMINVSFSVGKDFENSRLTNGGIFTLVNMNFALPSKESIKVE